MIFERPILRYTRPPGADRRSHDNISDPTRNRPSPSSLAHGEPRRHDVWMGSKAAIRRMLDRSTPIGKGGKRDSQARLARFPRFQSVGHVDPTPSKNPFELHFTR